MAGTGKSTIARTIARELHGRGYLGACFFFPHCGGDVGRAELFVATIVSQLAASEHLTVVCKQASRASTSKAVSGCSEFACKCGRTSVEFLSSVRSHS
jgi:hypothetical protein